MKKLLSLVLVGVLFFTLLTLPASAIPDDLSHTYISVYTHNHYSTAVYEARRVHEDRPSSSFADAEFYYYYMYGLTPIQPATARYNCHSYAWYSQDPGNTLWVDSISTFVSDATAIDPSDIQSGDIAVFVNYDGYAIHSAVIESIASFTDGNVTMVSKWGEYGVYRHSISNTPYSEDTYMFMFFRIECKYNRNYVDSGNVNHTAYCWCGNTQLQNHQMVQGGSQITCSKCGHVNDMWKFEPDLELE